jgi:sulfite reductase beta subunit-like hemoprotein
VLTRFAKERNAGERFGDWCNRVLFEQKPSGQPANLHRMTP